VELRSPPLELLALAFAAGVALVLAAGAALGWSRRRTLRARLARASAGEARAAGLLSDAGYAILGAQVAVEHAVWLDDRPVTAQLRADYLVAKAGARYVVEVKTGRVAPRIDTTATRRQLLEYRVAFDVDGVLLVDAEVGRIHVVTFPRLAPPRASRARSWALALLAVAAAVVALARS
jgi:threonine aldolase